MRKALVAGGVVAVVALVVVVALVLTRGGEDTPPDEAPPAELTGAAAELASMMERERSLTYYATYELVIEAESLPEGASASVQRWRKDGLARVDQETETQGTLTQLSQFALDERTITCVVGEDDAWQCLVISEGPQGQMAPDPMLGDIVEELRGGWEVEASDAQVGERSARCFAIASGQQEAEICLSSDGIPLRVTTGGIRLEIVDLKAGEVDDSVFELPAEPQAAGP